MNACERGSSSEKPSYAQLARLNESPRLRLAEAEAALQSLRTGKVDPDVVSSLDQSGSPSHAYVEQAADAVFVHDFQGQFLDVNKWACESVGYSSAELLGMNVQDIEQDFSLEGAQRAWSEIQPDQLFTLYRTHRRKDGTTFPVEVRFGSFDLDGERRFLNLARNISRRLQAEETLRSKERPAPHDRRDRQRRWLGVRC